MTHKKPLQLELTDERQAPLFSRSAMPISLTNKRIVEVAKETPPRQRHASAHHLRQIAKLKEAASITKPSNTMLDPQSVQKQLMQATTKFKLMPSPNPTLSSVNLQRPQSTGAFKARKIERTRFRYFYDRGDLPLRVNFAGAVRKLQWQVDLSELDYAHYLPMFMEGLRELDEPYQFLAVTGTMDLLEKGDGKPLTCLPLLVLPMKQNLMTRNHKILCVQMKVLQRLVQCCPFAGEALVPYYRQLLSIFNLFIAKRVNCGDAIDYGQRRQENLGDLILETLNILERNGGPDAFVNIKYMIPTYESCIQHN